MVLTYPGGGVGTKQQNDKTVGKLLFSGWGADADKVKERQELHSHSGAGQGDSAGVAGKAGSLSQHAGGVPF